jgi:hypothetical protein
LAKETTKWGPPLPGPPAVLAARNPQRKPRWGNLPKRPLWRGRHFPGPETPAPMGPQPA